MKILITGGAGFIGHHLVEHILKNTNWDITIVDRLTYASHGFDRLREVHAYENPRVEVFTADLSQPMGSGLRKEIGNPDYMVHLAAETHVDRSISDPEPFIQANVMGTFRVLQLARTMTNLTKMIYFSTDEVFGPASPSQHFLDWDRYNSTNPYSATKAAGEELALAWANTYGVPVMISHCMNAFGERQEVEKFVPLCISKILAGETIQIHTNSDRTISGSRFYIHARNIAAATLFLLEHGKAREKYNICGEREVTNVVMALDIGRILGKAAKTEMVDFHSSRPGHDLRYALNGNTMSRMGWKIPIGFEESLVRTVQWAVRSENVKWLTEVVHG